MSRHQAGRLAEAGRLYAEVLSREPKNVAALHLLGVVEFQQGNAPRAIELIGKALDLRPDYADAHINLGNVLKDQHKLEESAAAFRRALEISPDSANAQSSLGDVLATQGKLDQAAAAYRRSLELDPGRAGAHNNLGNVLKRRGKLDQAVAAYRRGLEIRPDLAEMHGNLGAALKDQGKLDEAVAAFRKALALNPDFAEVHGNLGAVHIAQGKLEEAMACYRRALDLKPDDAGAHINLGGALQHLGRLEEAVAAFRRGVELDPDLARAHYNLGQALQEQGRIDGAMARYRRALALKPDYGVARNNLGLALSYVGRPEDAVARARRALAKKPHATKAHLGLGIALWQHGKAEDAVAAFQRSLDNEPDDAAAHYHLGLARLTLGARGEALECIRRALALDPGDLYALAAEASIVAEDTFSKAPDRRDNVKRVALHMNQTYHYGILRPVFDACRERHATLFTPHVKELVDFDPDVVVVAESHASLLRPRLPRSLFVWVRHGLISKGTTCYAARVSDFACMTSKASLEWYAEHGGRPRRGFWITGYVQMDPLFRGGALPLPLALPAGRKTVLYAPTWNAELSSAPMLGDRAVELIRGARSDLTIVIKPHPVTAKHHPDWLATWQALAEADGDVHLIDDRGADIMPYLKAADVLVTDASSVMFEYLALDRPIILITNPSRYTSSHFDAQGIEWRCRDVGEELHDVEALPAAVDRALADPGSGAEKRAVYRTELFGDYTDGRAAERVADKVTELEL